MRRGFILTASLMAQVVWLASPAAASTGSWTIQPTPNPAAATSALLLGVSCPSAMSCTAVGNFQTSSAIATLAESWNGSIWAIQPTPNPPGATTASLDGVSCVPAAHCVAVGNSQVSGNKPVPLAEAWNGRTWAIQPAPHPAGATESSFDAVSCFSASDCTAVGSYQLAGNILTLAGHWNGSTWAMEPTPSPSAVFNQLLAVSCPAAAECIAVGQRENASGAIVPLAERRTGGTWVTLTTAAGGRSLDGVSCAGAGDCVAVGTAQTGALAERWNGSTWTVQSVPNPPSASLPTVGLAGVSCASATACTAVGSYVSTTGNNHAFAEHFSGGTWQFQPTAKSKHKVLTGAACTGGGCTAVGYRLGIPKTLAERN